VPSGRALSLVALPLVLHALAREVDRALGLVLRAEVETASLLGELGRAVEAEGPGTLLRVGSWLLGGLAIVAALAWRRRPFAPDATVLAPLLLRPALTALAAGRRPL
jgi:hypothetical protein